MRGGEDLKAPREDGGPPCVVLLEVGAVLRGKYVSTTAEYPHSRPSIADLTAGA